MIKRLSQYLFTQPDEIGFDNYLVLLLSFLTAFLGILGTIINILLQLGWPATLSTLIPTITITPLYLYSRVKGKYVIPKYILIISSLFLLTSQWFINYGSRGPVLYLFVVLQSFIIIFFNKWEKFIFTSLVFVDISILFLIEFYNPAIFGNYPSESARLLDLYWGMLIYLFISIIWLNVALKFYKNQQEKAQLSDKLKTAFLANMSHEIRTPMNGILGFASLLKDPALTGIEQQEYIQIIEKSGARMLNIINNIVDISKIEAGMIEIHLNEVNINEEVESLYSIFKPEVEAKGLRFLTQKSLPASESFVKTDREKLIAVLSNLIKNAIKYTNTGSIEFGYEYTADSLEFFVKDTGFGIPPKRLDAIFERFIQADINDKKALQGAGLGLSIAKAYIEMLKGKIWVESQEGTGSIFRFTIPYIIVQKDSRSNLKNVVSQTPDASERKLKILIAEDDETSEKLLTIGVKNISREILIASTGEAAVEICRLNPDIDLILMDILLPEMNGYEATRQIRQFNNDVIIIAQTAFGLAGDREKAIESGCTDYLSKPIDYKLFTEIIYTYFKLKTRF